LYILSAELPELAAIPCRNGSSARFQNHPCSICAYSACAHTRAQHESPKPAPSRPTPLAAVKHSSSDEEMPLTIMNVGLSAEALALVTPEQSEMTTRARNTAIGPLRFAIAVCSTIATLVVSIAKSQGQDN